MMLSAVSVLDMLIVVLEELLSPSINRICMNKLLGHSFRFISLLCHSSVDSHLSFTSDELQVTMKLLVGHPRTKEFSGLIFFSDTSLRQEPTHTSLSRTCFFIFKLEEDFDFATISLSLKRNKCRS